MVKGAEPKILFAIASFINSFSSLVSMALAKRWNKDIGIPDPILYWSTDMGLSTIVFAF